MQPSLHPVQARSVVRIRRSSETAFSELLTLELGPVAALQTKGDVPHTVQRVRDMESLYIGSGVMFAPVNPRWWPEVEFNVAWGTRMYC